MGSSFLGLRNYATRGRLGGGGMGLVYRVWHRPSGELRVAKVLHRDLRSDPALVARFAREAKLLGRLRHRHLARLLEVVTGAEGELVAVMEFVDGVTLGELLRQWRPLPLGLVAILGRQVAEALAHLHAHGWVHRDISPDNLMLRRPTDSDPEPLAEGADGGIHLPQVVLLDLGIAKSLATPPTSSETTLAPLTATGGFLGKVKYSSPEQLAGRQVDGRSDLYSLGVVLYECLTGRCPIEGDGPESWVAGHLMYPPRPLRPEDGVPEELGQVVLALLAKTPDERLDSAEELAAILGRWEARADVSDLERTQLDETIRRAMTIRQSAAMREGSGPRSADGSDSHDEATATLPRAQGRSDWLRRDPPSQVSGAEPDASQKISSRGSTADQIETPRVETPRVETWRVQTPRVQTPRARRPILAVAILAVVAVLVALGLAMSGLISIFEDPPNVERSRLETRAVEGAGKPPGPPTSEPAFAPIAAGPNRAPAPTDETAGEAAASTDRILAEDAEPVIEDPAPADPTEAGAASLGLDETGASLASSGRLSLDARPWAELVRLRDGQGRSLPLPPTAAARTTPLALALQKGSYMLSLRHPDRADPLEIRVDVAAGKGVTTRVEMLEAPVDAFLRDLYLDPAQP